MPAARASRNWSGDSSGMERSPFNSGCTRLFIAALTLKYDGAAGWPSVTRATNSSSLIGCTEGLVRRCSPIVDVSSDERFLPHDDPAPCAGMTVTSSGNASSVSWMV